MSRCWGDPANIILFRNGNRHGFLLSQGAYPTLDVPGASVTIAQGINNAGVILGLYRDAAGNEHGFVFSQNVYRTIDVANSTGTTVFSINAQGEIVGSYDDTSGVTHGYIGTPTR